MISECPCIFITLFDTNCLYSLPPSIHWRATELSSHPWLCFTGKPWSALPTFVTRFAAICADTSSNRGMMSPCFASRTLAVINPWLTPDGCLTTACTVAHTPFLLASPKACSLISSISSCAQVKALGAVTLAGNSFFRHVHWLASCGGSGASQATFMLQTSV